MNNFIIQGTTGGFHLPNITTGARLFDYMKFYLITGGEYMKPDGVNGQIMIVNNGLIFHEGGTFFEFSDGNNVKNSKLKVLDSNNFEILEDLSGFNLSNLKFRIPPVQGWELVEEDSEKGIFKNSYSQILINKNSINYTITRGGIKQDLKLYEWGIQDSGGVDIVVGAEIVAFSSYTHGDIKSNWPFLFCSDERLTYFIDINELNRHGGQLSNESFKCIDSFKNTKINIINNFTSNRPQIGDASSIFPIEASGEALRNIYSITVYNYPENINAGFYYLDGGFVLYCTSTHYNFDFKGFVIKL